MSNMIMNPITETDLSTPAGRTRLPQPVAEPYWLCIKQVGDVAVYVGWKPVVGWSAKWLHRGRSNNTVIGPADDSYLRGSRQGPWAHAMSFGQAKPAALAWAERQLAMRSDLNHSYIK